MKVLVTAASKHAATEEIAQAIGDALTARGIDVAVTPVDDVASVEDYDAIVAGGAVYAGRWMKSAMEFVERNAEGLRARPVWLFSSGPVGDPPKPEEAPGVVHIIEATAARDHRVVAGGLDRGLLGLGERVIVKAVRAPEGDCRDWEEVRAWASSIANSLGADQGEER
jgi:menaquinone-dependent protoporphyrinogen oxidase